MKKRYYLLPCLCLPFLTACTEHKTVDLNLHYVTTDSVPGPATDKNAQASLSEAAVSVNHSLQDLSAMQMAVEPDVKIPAAPNPAAIGMNQNTSVDWVGPVEPLLQQIAKAAHYRVRVLGQSPAIAVFVTINKHDVPLADILRDATYQVARKATILIYPSSRIIELRYKSA